MKYSAPEIEVIELNNIDVIQTSGEEGESGGTTPGEGNNRLPWG